MHWMGQQHQGAALVLKDFPNGLRLTLLIIPLEVLCQLCPGPLFVW